MDPANLPPKKRSPMDGLRRLGFDRTTWSRWSGETHYHIRCSQCEALVINGCPTHERGCPNSPRASAEMETDDME